MFPSTHHSAIAGLASPDPAVAARSLDAVAAVYWRPLYKYVRLRWCRDGSDAEDLIQGFFAVALARDALAGYDPSRGRFRTFLRRCVDRYAIDAHRRSHAQRRGGGGLTVDFDAAEREVASALGHQPDEAFEREWLRHLLAVATARLEASLVAKGKPLHAALFRSFHDSDPPPSYAAAAATHGVTVTDVTNWLAYARREFRRIALELLRELTGSDEEFAAEARAVFGIEIAPPA
ncbi:MAG: sigma-70 family RNA polymerase sigma factor [Kofleriaceae bacterium]